MENLGLRSLALDVNSWIIGVALVGLLFFVPAVDADAHPDCTNTKIGIQNQDDGTCGWKFHKAEDIKDTQIHTPGTCIGCVTNACRNTNAPRCPRECPEYWRLCVNYTAPTIVNPPYSVGESKEKEETHTDSTRVTAIVVPIGLLFVITPTVAGVVYYKKRRAAPDQTQYHAQATSADPEGFDEMAL